LSYIDFEQLESLDVESFRGQTPYPWINPPAVLTSQGYSELCKSLPQPDKFDRQINVKRKHNQSSHDRLALEWREGLELAQPWDDFINELRGKRYLEWLQEMFEIRKLRLGFHWHYTFRGGSVSPHCDSKHKLGSHIFYFNTEDDWQPEWGGETLLLDDGGRLDRRSAPDFDDFEAISQTKAMGNRSLLFRSNGRSWHGVREILCPEGRYRKVFISLIYSETPIDRARALVHKFRRGY